MMSEPEDLIKRYEAGMATLEEALRGAPEAILDRRPAPGKWTIREQAAHLADAELVVSARFRWIAAEPGAALPAWDQDKWAASLGYGQQSPGESAALVRALRQRTAVMLRQLPEEAWRRTGMHAERGSVTLRELVELDVTHLEHHAGHIRELRTKLAA
jgi:hypothetical protein